MMNTNIIDKAGMKKGCLLHIYDKLSRRRYSVIKVHKMNNVQG